MYTIFFFRIFEGQDKDFGHASIAVFDILGPRRSAPRGSIFFLRSYIYHPSFLEVYLLRTQGRVVAQGSVNDIMDSNANIIDTLKELNLRKENQDRGDNKLRKVHVSLRILTSWS